MFPKTVKSGQSGPLMNGFILGVGTATPAASVPQEEALAMSTAVVCENTRQERMMRILFRRSGIDRRGAVLPTSLGREWKARPDALNPGHGPRTSERMELYGKFAGPLAESASVNALQDAGCSPQEITHLVTVSCTGFGAPGVDIGLIKSLGLRSTIQRINVGFMGCHGAINGMRAVRGIVAAEPQARVLMCAVELCSLHYRMAWDDEGIIGNALFADGAAALVAAGTFQNVPPLWQMSGSGSCLIPDSADAMSWHVGDHGFNMRLTGEVADLIESSLRPWMEEWLGTLGCSFEKIGAWAVHPGGPRILDAVETALNLSGNAVTVSRDVLREHGNMSSPTVLFVLDRMRKAGTPGPIVALAFGPGLMAEAALLTPAE